MLGLFLGFFFGCLNVEGPREFKVFCFVGFIEALGLRGEVVVEGGGLSKASGQVGCMVALVWTVVVLGKGVWH